MSKVTEADRLASVNEFIKVIGSCGRKFFRNDANDRFANMEVDAQGKVWFIDDYTTRRIYTHYERCWSGFSHGGTLRDLVRVFRDHIKRGVQIHSKYFQARSRMSCGHPWGYPEEDLRRLESEGRRLGIVAEEQEQAS